MTESQEKPILPITVDDDMLIRWINDVDPLIKRLARVAEKLETDRRALDDPNRAAAWDSFIQRVSDDLVEELDDIKNALIDAKGRLLLGPQ